MNYKKIVEYAMIKIVLSNTMLRVFSLLPKSTTDTFVKRVTIRRFERYLDGYFRGNVQRFMNGLYRRERSFAPAVTAIGTMTFKYLPVDLSDTREPEVRVFTEDDICSTLSEDVIDSVREAKWNREAKIQPDLWKDLRVYTSLSTDEIINKEGE